MKDVTSVPAAKTADASWLQNARLTLEWLHPKRGLDVPSWVREVVERAQAVNIEALAFDFAHGGYAVFNDAVAAKDRHIGSADVIALLDEELHGRGMRLVLMNMGAHCNSYASDEYHSWRVRDPAGEPTVGLRSYAMCLNSPYFGLSPPRDSRPTKTILRGWPVYRRPLRSRLPLRLLPRRVLCPLWTRTPHRGLSSG